MCTGYTTARWNYTDTRFTLPTSGLCEHFFQMLEMDDQYAITAYCLPYRVSSIYSSSLHLTRGKT